MQPPSPSPVGYHDALAYIYGRIDYERHPPAAAGRRAFRLRRMQALLDLLGNPERAARIVHVAGTKGKGSTTTLVASILTAAGIRTGRYTSPHLERLEERFVVDHRPCSAVELIDLVQAVRPAADRLAATEHGPPTFFELTTAIAFEHFARQSCGWVVLEVGLGGRLDSTNVCQPDVTAITTIGLDHQQILGSTLALIAREKAGIIKTGVPMVCGVRHGDAAAVIRSIADQRAAPLWHLGHDFDVRPLNPPPEPWGAAFDYVPRTNALQGGALRPCGNHGQRLGLRLRMEGRHQVDNAGVALAIIDRLIAAGLDVSEQAIRHGLLVAQAPARLQLFPGRPAVLLDTAHNPDSIAALAEVLRNRALGRRCIVVFSASRDKDVATMLQQLEPFADAFVLTQFVSNPRATTTTALAAKLCRQDNVTEIAFPAEALALARHKAGPDGLIIITGSFFLAAELLPLL